MWHRLDRDDFDRTNELKRNPDSASKVWGVCQEYELRELPETTENSSPYCLAPKYPDFQEQEDKWRMYRPLEDTPDLFLKFARLYEQGSSIELIVDWVNRYGVLGDSGSGRGWKKTQDISRFRNMVSVAAGTLALYEAVLNGDEEEARALIFEEFRWLGVSWYTWVKPPLEDFPHVPATQVSRDTGVALISEMVEEDHNGDYLDYALWGVVQEVNMIIRSTCHPVLELGEGTHRKPSKVRTSWSFFSLLDAMFFQMHWLIAAGGSVTRCKYCGRIVSLASPLPGARKARQDKQFCDNACRQRYHYHHRVKPKNSRRS